MTPSGDNFNNVSAQWPYRLLLMIKDILSLDRPDAMIQQVLNAALEFSDMQRAVLILLEEPPRIFRSASVEDGAIRDICEISNSALATVSAARAPFVCLDAAVNAHFQGNPSIIANRIMSIVCLPLSASGVVRGVLYLDSREGVESLSRTETVLMEIFASIISMILEKAIALERSLAENSRVKEPKSRGAFPEFVGVSRQVHEIRRQVRELQDSDITVLITGETGTGKELVARVIHYTGDRRNGPFLAVNCSAFSKEELESELFGHEKSAFTGATQQKQGLFEQADEGTFFLDEIDEMPWEMQDKLLRVLESREFQRVGGLETLHTSARIVLATHRDLEKMVQETSFRKDLYDRIKGVQVRIPPLRERPEDILPLADAFLKGARTTTRRTIHGFSPEAQELIRAYNWPGNARQLKNEIERIVALSVGEWIDAVDFEPGIQKAIQSRAGISNVSLREIEKRVIVERLQEFDENVLLAAKSLGLSRDGLYGKMRRYSITLKKQG
ncbi:MAG TPA: sigma-54-dependent Fis family transcriptional regulator [Acidobacteriota bacterium]|nr:sigma-54-dependent Fis family transcriptional regulator [Acidobacteriota bacterium]